MAGELSRQPVVLSFSRIARDRRVLRQCDLLRDLGARPRVVAYAQEGDAIACPLDAWPTPQPTTAHRLKTTARQLPALLGLAAARAGFWIEPRFRWALQRLRAARPAFVVANDWPALVVAARWARESGARLHYDSHEFATQEFQERAWWRLVYKPMVTALERDAIGQANSISTVGPGIARAMADLYALDPAPTVVRNMPERIDLTPYDATPQWPLRLLFHGQLLPQRGIEQLIDAAAMIASPHRFIFRGDSPPAYLEALRARVAPSARERVAFEPPVPPAEVSRRAAEAADLGLTLAPLDTLQRRFSMPNKLFEYLVAGLGVLTSPADDMRALVEAYGVGVVAQAATAEAAAAAIDTLTVERVAAFRVAARRAAGELCWERERERLAALFAPALAQGAA